jgi:hypothetical protein
MNTNQKFLIKHIPNTNLYDVWQGQGWDQWSRVLVKADFVTVIKGEKIPVKLLYKLFETEQKRKVAHVL